MPLVVAKAGDGLFHLSGLANGRRVDFVIDTGATTSVIDLRLAAALGVMPDAAAPLTAAPTAAQAPVVVNTAAGPVAMRRAEIARLTLAGRSWDDVPVIITRLGPGPALLGQDVIARLGTLRLTADQLEIS